jgi:hypothetical protein
VFTSERGASFTTAGFACIIERAGIEAKLGFKAHPHMLRHACGYALGNKGHDTRALPAYDPIKAKLDSKERTAVLQAAKTAARLIDQKVKFLDQCEQSDRRRRR